MYLTGRPARRRVMARCRAVYSSFMGASVVRPPAVAHGGHSSQPRRPAPARSHANGRRHRHGAERGAGGSARQKLSDELAESHLRSPVGSQLTKDREGRLTRTREFVGSLRYASPEQVLDAGQVDHRSDIYSLGVTLWELLTLHPIYGIGKSVRDSTEFSPDNESSRACGPSNHV